MGSKAFWISALDRAVKSFAQALILLWGADAGLNLLEIDLVRSLGVAASALVLSLLTSVASAPLGGGGDGDHTTCMLPGCR